MSIVIVIVIDAVNSAQFKVHMSGYQRDQVNHPTIGPKTNLCVTNLRRVTIQIFHSVRLETARPVTYFLFLQNPIEG